MKFTPINFDQWPRREIFYYYSKMAPTGYSLTVNIDVTKLLPRIKDKKIKFTPVYLWAVTKNINRQTEFKIAYQGETLGYYDELTPLYATFHDDDKTFSLMHTEFKQEFKEFYNDYLVNQQKYGANHGVICQKDTPPAPNSFVVSCLPWISFEHFAVHSYQNNPYFFPSIEAGKFFESDGRMLLPLSITCHHATTDGYHVNAFLKDLQEELDTFTV